MMEPVTWATTHRRHTVRSSWMTSHMSVQRGTVGTGGGAESGFSWTPGLSGESCCRNIHKSHLIVMPSPSLASVSPAELESRQEKRIRRSAPTALTLSVGERAREGTI